MNSKAVSVKSAPNKPGKSGDSSALDIVKYVIAGLLAAGGVFAFYWFQGQWPTWARALVVVAGLILGALVFMTSSMGPKLREFFFESRFELRKVVWPTRQEAMRQTWVVAVVVVLISLLLAGFDLIIQTLMKWFLG